MENKLTFAERIAAVRRECSPAHKMADELAEITGNSPATVKGWMIGRYTPNEEARRRIAEAWGCTVDELFPPRDANR